MLDTIDQEVVGAPPVSVLGMPGLVGGLNYLKTSCRVDGEDVERGLWVKPPSRHRLGCSSGMLVPDLLALICLGLPVLIIVC